MDGKIGWSILVPVSKQDWSLQDGRFASVRARSCAWRRGPAFLQRLQSRKNFDFGRSSVVHSDRYINIFVLIEKRPPAHRSTPMCISAMYLTEYKVIILIMNNLSIETFVQWMHTMLIRKFVNWEIVPSDLL